MRQIILFFLLSISNLTFAQLTDDKRTLIIKGNITSLIDVFTFPTIQFSAEKKITNYVSLNAEFGYQIYDFNHMDTTFLSLSGYKANIEFRYYISKFIKKEKVNKFIGIYLGFQPFYRQNQYNANISYITKTDSINIKRDVFGVKNTTYGLNCIIGLQRSIYTKLVFDLYIGIGIMQRIINNTNRQYNEDSGDYITGTGLVPLFSKYTLSESSGNYGNFLLGFRIGYKL